jgi:hypothetical protein
MAYLFDAALIRWKHLPLISMTRLLFSIKVIDLNVAQDSLA